MQIELFVHFAEIAGVFVGFGALISLRSTQFSDVHDVVYLEAVLGQGIWVMIAALVPIAVSRYGVQGHPLWLSSAVVALVIWFATLVVFVRRPETRAIDKSPEPADRFFYVLALPLHLIIAGSLILIVLGVWHGVDAALYVTALAAAVVFAGYTLLMCVMSQKHEIGPDQNGVRESGPERPPTSQPTQPASSQGHSSA